MLGPSAVRPINIGNSMSPRLVSVTRMRFLKGPICTVVSITEIPDEGSQFTGWSATDDNNPIAGCDGSTSAVCTVKLVNHRSADNVGPQQPDDYSISANFCSPAPSPYSGRGPC